MDKPRKLELVDNRYQPTKAQKDAVVDFSDLEGMTPEEMASGLMQPAAITFITKPRT